MSVTDVLMELDQALACLEAQGDRLRVRALWEEKPLSPDTIALCRRHKPALLAYLAFAGEADDLLLSSTRRLAEAWPPGCHLQDDERWERAEHALHEAYWSQDLLRVKNAISTREQVASDVFAAFRKERAA